MEATAAQAEAATRRGGPTSPTAASVEQRPAGGFDAFWE